MQADDLGNGPGFPGIDKYTEQLKSDPNDWQAYNFRGQYQAAIGPSHYQLALDDFTKEIELAQNYCRANGRFRIINSYRQLDTNYCIRDGYIKRAQVYERLAQYQKAVDDCSKAISMILQLAEMYRRRAEAEAAIKIARNMPFSAETQARIRQLNNISIDCTGAIYSSRSFAAPYYVRAQAYLGLERYPQAIDDITKAISFNAKDWRLYNLRASAFEKSGKYQQAIDDYTKATTLIHTGFKFINQRAALYDHRADCYEKMGKLNLAQKDREKASKQGDLSERK
jgi:tetratricopeptide (TPR) repeat protein